MDDLTLLRENPLFAAYAVILLLGGLVALGIAFVQLPRQRRLGLPGVTPWTLRTSDFILFVCAFLLWYIFASSLAVSLSTRFTAEDETPSVFFIAIANLVLHGGLIILFWRWREGFRTLEERALNPAQLTLWQAVGTGAFYLFAAYPLVFVVALLWETILSFGQDAGLNISLAPQPAIELFHSTTDPWAYLALGLVAVVAAPIAEELIFRGGFYRFFSGRFGKASGAVLTGLIFGFLHGNLVGFVPLAFLGIVFCVAYELTGNLRVPIVMHALFNLNTLVLLVITPEGLAAQ